MNILELLNLNEDEHNEFKEAKKHYEFDKLAQYACALSNRGGGRIIFGITDERPRQVVGSQAFERPERTRQTLMEWLGVNVTFELVDNNGLRVLVFYIASRPIGLPIQCKGVYWWRHGESLVPMPPEVLRSIYAESGHDFSADICPKATIDDLDPKAVERFRKKWARKSRLKRLNSLSTEQLLKDCDAITDEGVTYAALILFGKKSALTKYLAQCEIVFEYRSTQASGPAQQREELRDAFFNIYDRLWKLVNLRNDKQHYQDELFVYDVDTFNERVVREALLNAVCHRNYQLCGSVFVIQYPDKLIISSPGGFPHGITPENVLDKQSPRNRRVAELLAKCGLVERSGQGMNLIYETCVKESKALPDFTGSDEGEVKMTLRGLVLDKDLLCLLNKVNANTLACFSTQDFVVLSFLSRGEQIPAVFQENVQHLLGLGVIEQPRQGTIKLSAELSQDSNITENKTIQSEGTEKKVTDKKDSDKPAKTPRLSKDEREQYKALILQYIEQHNATGVRFSEFFQILPNLTRRQIQRILRKLSDEKKIRVEGSTTSSKFILTTDK